MIDESYSSFTKAGPNKGNYKPDEPENHRKERKEGKKARAREKKRLATVCSFYSVDFGEKCRRSLTEPYSRHIYILSNREKMEKRYPVENLSYNFDTTLLFCFVFYTIFKPLFY